MSFFNSNITGAGGSGGSGGTAGGLVTKFEKSVTIGSEATAEIVINLADDISNYQNITNEQIIVELQKISVSLDSGTSGYANLEHSYNQETGDLTITSSTSLMPFRHPSEMTLPIAIYVAGAVQLPPELTLGNICYNNCTTSTEFGKTQSLTYEYRAIRDGVCVVTGSGLGNGGGTLTVTGDGSEELLKEENRKNSVMAAYTRVYKVKTGTTLNCVMTSAGVSASYNGAALQVVEF